jgi:hypothetical protein
VYELILFSLLTRYLIIVPILIYYIKDKLSPALEYPPKKSFVFDNCKIHNCITMDKNIRKKYTNTNHDYLLVNNDKTTITSPKIYG